MRLKCDVDIVNRLLPSQNMKKLNRACRTMLSIGRKPGQATDSAIFLMLCTAKDRNGIKYVVKDNIKQVFTKFVNEGKATIRFIKPEQDICIAKADPLELRSFLNVLRQTVHGETIERTILSSLAPASCKNVEKLKTSMVIMSKRDYPLTTNFPSSLEMLQVSECSLKRIDSRIFQLRNLRVLNLSNNVIQALPDDVGKATCLQELHVCQNKISTFPPLLCRSSLGESLALLDLTGNNLEILPPHLGLLRRLVTLNLNSNQLKSLPANIGMLSNLRYFSAAQNKINLLPASFLRLQLNSVDLFGNPLAQTNTTLTSDRSILTTNLGAPTLMEISARAIRGLRVAYSSQSIPEHLCQYLDAARQCWCGNYCFNHSVRHITSVNLHRVAATITAIDMSGLKDVPVEAFLCSNQCLTKFKKNPYAYWR